MQTSPYAGVAAVRASGHVYERATASGPRWYSRVRVSDPSRACGYRDERRAIGPAWTGKGSPPPGMFTRRTARAVLQERLVDARRRAGARVLEAATFAAGADTLLRHLERVKGAESRTVDDYRAILRARLLPAFGPRPLASIEPRELAAYRDRLLEEGRLSARSVTRDLVLVHAIYRRAIADGRAESNPATAAAVERPRQAYDATRFAVLTAEQARAVAAACETPTDAAIVLAGAFAGLRLGELAALRWEDVAPDVLHVRRSWNGRREKAPKSGKGRAVPLVLELRRALDALRVDRDVDGLVFSDPRGGRLDGDAFRRRFYVALDCAGLGAMRDADPPLRVHDLRHTFGTLAVRTAPIRTVQAWMGHASVTTTERYVHHVPADDDAERLGRAFGAAA